MAALMVVAVLMFLSFKKDCIIGDERETSGAVPEEHGQGRVLLLNYLVARMLPVSCMLDVEEADGFPPDAESHVGSREIAAILGVGYSRRWVKLRRGDVAYVVVPEGGNIPMGSVSLPEGVTLRYLKITVI